MNITFQKKPGNASLGIAFYWFMTVKTQKPITISDHFIPELFYDYFLIQAGTIQCQDEIKQTQFTLPYQSLKTLHTHPLTFTFTTPLVLFGARLSLPFAAFYQGKPLKANTFLELNWAHDNPLDFSTFVSQVTTAIQAQQKPQPRYPLLAPDFTESAWLAAYSPRHKRRLYKNTFGLSRKEIDSINLVHSFLEQTCDFAGQNPRIISHLDPDVFYDQAHLNHAFKKMTGFSPLEYFEAPSILQDNLMAASYKAFSPNNG